MGSDRRSTARDSEADHALRHDEDVRHAEDLKTGGLLKVAAITVVPIQRLITYLRRGQRSGLTMTR